MAIPVRKLKKDDSYPVDGFTTTDKHVILMCGNVDGNANKFYVLELQTNGSEFRLFSEYGRIGVPNPARDLRENLDQADADIEFERIKKSKLKKKTKTRKLVDGDDKHAEQYREVDIAAPTIGSPNIRVAGSADGSTTTTTTKKSGNSAVGAIFGQMGYQPAVQTLLSQLLAENIHSIEASSSIKVTHNGLETPLGPITHSHIEIGRASCRERV